MFAVGGTIDGRVGMVDLHSGMVIIYDAASGTSTVRRVEGDDDVNFVDDGPAMFSASDEDLARSTFVKQAQAAIAEKEKKT